MTRRSVLSITLPTDPATPGGEASVYTIEVKHGGDPETWEVLASLESPAHLPLWLNVALGFGAAAGATERAMRMRYHWLLDSGAGI
jgi:hypothetical protein